ncbi:hypothetical protein [Kitasatospora sp. P5_F3]
MLREYHLTPDELWHMSQRQFLTLLKGLSPEAAVRGAFQRTPRRVASPREIAALTGIPAS